MQTMSAIGAWANSFHDMLFIIEMEQTQRMQISASMPVTDLTASGRLGVLTLHHFGISTTEKAREVTLQYRVYEEGSAADSWKESGTANVNTMGVRWQNNPGIDLLQGLHVGGTYFLEFRMKGIGTDGTEFYYDNGGQNYKMKFVMGDAPKVKFVGGELTASVLLNVDGVNKQFMMPEKVWDGVNLGKSSSIGIGSFRANTDKFAQDMSVDRLSMNYALCKKGEKVTHWHAALATTHRVEYQRANYSREEHSSQTSINIMDKLHELYPAGLVDGEEYELCIGFDLKDSEGNTRAVDNNGEGYRFSFVYSATPLGPDDRAEFNYTSISLNKNGEYTGFGLDQPHSSNLDLTQDTGVWGLTMRGFSTYPSYAAKEVKLNYRIYEGTTPKGGWKSLAAKSNGAENAYWSYDAYNGDEPVEMFEGTEIGKVYTLEYYLSGITTTDKAFYQNNDGKNFTIKFSPAPATEQFNYVRIDATTGLNTDVEQGEINLPPYNMATDDMSGGGRVANNVFTINKITADMSVSATAFDLYYSVYRYGTEATEWKKVTGTSADGHTWTCTPAANLMAGLAKGKNYILEFYFKATVEGNDVLFNNGDNNYKLQFLCDDQNPDVGETGFNVDGQKMVSVAMTSDLDEPYKYMYNLASCKSEYENGAVQLGEIPMLTFSAFRAMWKRESTDVEIAEMSVQYKIYEPGQDGQWNGIVARDNFYMEDQLEASSQWREGFTFTDLVGGKTYILELMPQLRTVDGKYYFLNDTDESTNGNNVGFKFQFTYAETTGVDTIVSPSTSTTTLYNLAGQRVDKAYKGIVISNGKKILRR